MQLSNKEREYRNKIISENHLKKDAQRYVDFYIAENNAFSINLTYKRLYSDYGLLHSILVKYNFSKINNALKNVGESCVKVGKALQLALYNLNNYTT